jgi:MFS family permease
LAAQTTHAMVSSPREALIIAAIGTGTFVFSFQVAAVLVALPAITGFVSPTVPAAWIVTIYLLCLTAFLLLFGRLGDVCGNRRLYIGGLCIFTVASILCSIVPSASLLLLARAAQGVGAALSSANSPALLIRHLVPARHGRALGWQATMTYVGLTAGPAIAAFLLARYVWRAIFLIDVPVGIIAVCLALYALPPDPPFASIRSAISLSGAALWPACLIPLLLALSYGSQWGWLSAPTLALFLVFFLAFLALVVAERRTSHPLVNFNLFRNRSFSLSIACEALFYFGIYAIAFLIPVLVIRARGLGAAEAGAMLTTQSFVRMSCAALAGTAADHYGAGRLIAAGSAMFAFGAMLLMLYCDHGSMVLLGLAMAFTGLGASSFVPANGARLFASLSMRHHGMAAGMLATARNLGMLLGTAAAAAACAKSLRLGKAGETLSLDIRTGFCFVFVAAMVSLIANSFDIRNQLPVVRTKTSSSAAPD